MDFDNEYEEYKKIINLIIVTEKNNKNEIWKMANNLNTLDIISFNKENVDYIAKRIENILND